MSKPWINKKKVFKQLQLFFDDNIDDLTRFGNTINQVFEAFVFASLASWYKSDGWTIRVMNPKNMNDKEEIRLKFSTRGRPANYTHIECERDGETVQIRHQLRVATRHHTWNQYPPANICLDVAVVKDVGNLEYLSTDDYLSNESLVTFAEAKHMSAFAELVANFIGLVHEIQPNRLKRIRIGKCNNSHPAPFLYVSGVMYRTAEGIMQTIERRKFDIDVYNKAKHLIDAFEKDVSIKDYFEKCNTED